MEILGGPEDQQDPQGNATYLIWYQNSEARPRTYNMYASADGGATKFRLNRTRTTGFTGDLDQDGTEAIYQEIRRGQSNIQIIDLASRARSNPPAGINTRQWEWAPRLSDEFILFEREFPRTDRSRLILFDRNAQTNATLLDVHTRIWIYPYDVGSQYASWEREDNTGWSAWIYDIVAETKTRIPTVNNQLQYAPVVDELHWNVYWVRSGRGNCGNNVRILRAPVSSLDTPTVVATMPDGVDVWTQSLEQNVADGRIDLLFTRYRCRNNQGDLYEVQGVDTLGP